MWGPVWPKTGADTAKGRTGFLGLPRKDLRYSGQAPGDGVGGGGCHLALEQSLQIWFPAAEEASHPGLGLWAFTLEKLGGWGIISKGSHLGEGLDRAGLKLCKARLGICKKVWDRDGALGVK